jgi:NAD(P)-dependent dehydrogenase (short-subunit alcohol dehydrogenase family)
VSDSASRNELFNNLAERFGKLDILFANAGIAGRRSTPEELFENIIRVNLMGVFFTVQGALPLLNDGSSIILTGSIDGVIGQSSHAAYAASKAGIRGMARTMVTDLWPRRIRVNVVSPGAVRTPIWDHGNLSPFTVKEISKRVEAAIPLGRWGEPGEIAKAVLFLASDDSSYVQSIELFVDGGMTGTPRGGPMFGQP